MNYIIIRHFKTFVENSSEKINLHTIYDNAKPYIIFILNILKMNNYVNEIIFITSPSERCFITASVISFLLQQKLKNISINIPIIENIIDRDPLKKKFKKIKNFLKHLINIEHTNNNSSNNNNTNIKLDIHLDNNNSNIIIQSNKYNNNNNIELRNNKLIILVTHSSIYSHIFNSIVKIISNKKLKYKETIHQASMSYINITDTEINYIYNCNLKNYLS